MSSCYAVMEEEARHTRLKPSQIGFFLSSMFDGSLSKPRAAPGGLGQLGGGVGWGGRNSDRIPQSCCGDGCGDRLGAMLKCDSFQWLPLLLGGEGVRKIGVRAGSS
jgi:hypothetical protein